MNVAGFSNSRASSGGAMSNILTWFRKRNGREITFIYLELPDVRRISLETLARRLGYGAKKKLHKNGIVRDRAFGEKLLGNWNQF